MSVESNVERRVREKCIYTSWKRGNKRRELEDLSDQCDTKKKLVKCGCQGNSGLISIWILPERAEETTSVILPFVILLEVCCPCCDTWRTVTHTVLRYQHQHSASKDTAAWWIWGKLHFSRNPPESFFSKMMEWNKKLSVAQEDT